MKTNTLLIIVLVGAVLLSAGCLGGGTTPGAGTTTPGGTTPGTTTPGGSGTTTFRGLDACLGDCQNNPESVRFLCYQACYSEDAKAARDANRCDPLMTRYNLTLSYQVCLEDVGTVIHSTAPCDKVADELERGVCVSEIAQFTHDAALCDNLRNSNPAFQQSFQADCRKQATRTD